MADYIKKIKKRLTEVDPLFFARILIVLELVGLIFSTAATSVVEVMVFLIFISFGTLRRRVLNVLHQPIVMAALALYVMVGLGMIYSASPVELRMDMFGSWRKYLLVPLVVSVFDEPLWKFRLCIVFIFSMVFVALVSFAGVAFDYGIYKYPVGIVANNHGTQSMFFAAATLACLILLRFPWEKKQFPEWVLWISAGIMILNLIFVTGGRSGYLALIVGVVLIAFWETEKKTRLLFGLIAPLIILAMIAASQSARERVSQGIDEMFNYESASEKTSMGIRIVLLQNTFEILKKFEHPFLGYGTASFETIYSEYVAGQEGWRGEPAHDPHNQYVLIFFEHGILGIGMFFVFIVSFFRQRVIGTYHYLGISILLAWCATSMFSGHFTTFHEGRFLLISCGAMLASRTPETIQEK